MSGEPNTEAGRALLAAHGGPSFDRYDAFPVDADEVIAIEVQASNSGSAESREYWGDIRYREGYAAGTADCQREVERLRAALLGVSHAMERGALFTAHDILRNALAAAEPPADDDGSSQSRPASWWRDAEEAR